MRFVNDLLFKISKKLFIKGFSEVFIYKLRLIFVIGYFVIIIIDIMIFLSEVVIEKIFEVLVRVKRV